jgi:hypothetical protein
MDWFVFPLFLVLVGAMHLVGTYKRLPFVVDQRFMNTLTKRRGHDYAIMYSYLIGAGLIVVSVFALVLALYGPK